MKFWQLLQLWQCFKIFDKHWQFFKTWQYWQFKKTIYILFVQHWQLLQLWQCWKFSKFVNKPLWTCWHFWQLRTSIHDNHCDLYLYLHLKGQSELCVCVSTFQSAIDEAGIFSLFLKHGQWMLFIQTSNEFTIYLMPFFMMLYSPQPRRGGRARRTPHTFSEKTCQKSWSLLTFHFWHNINQIFLKLPWMSIFWGKPTQDNVTRKETSDLLLSEVCWNI